MNLQPNTVTSNGIRITGKTRPTLVERITEYLDRNGFIDSKLLTAKAIEWGAGKNSPLSAMHTMKDRVVVYRINDNSRRRVYLKRGFPESAMLREYPDAVVIAPAPPKPAFPKEGFKTRLVERYEAADGTLFDKPEDAQRHTWIVPLTAALEAAGVPDAEVIATIVAGIVRDPGVKS